MQPQLQASRISIQATAHSHSQIEPNVLQTNLSQFLLHLFNCGHLPKATEQIEEDIDSLCSKMI